MLASLSCEAFFFLAGVFSPFDRLIPDGGIFYEEFFDISVFHAVKTLTKCKTKSIIYNILVYFRVCES